MKKQPELTVWYGSLPESNGKSNWTAILHRKDESVMDGITIDRSEYPDRVRYEADRMRFMIGELSEDPDILAYDPDLHSDYVYPKQVTLGCHCPSCGGTDIQYQVVCHDSSCVEYAQEDVVYQGWD